MRHLRSRLLIALGALVIFGGGPLVALYTDVLWFQVVGFQSVLYKSIAAQWLVGLAGGLATGLFVYLNLSLALSQARFTGPVNVINMRGEVYETEPAKLGKFAWLAALVAGLVGGIAASPFWLTVLRFLQGGSFGSTDPLFGRDVAFYIFRLPVYEALYTYLFSLTLLMVIAGVAVYALTGGASLLNRSISLGPRARVHLSLLLSLLLGLKAWGYWLNAFNLVYSPRGVAFGASYTDVHAQLPALRLLTVLALAAALGLAANAWLRRGFLLWGLPGLVLAASVLAGSIYPSLMQQFIVRPNELARESAYIMMNVENTQKAFGLDRVAERDFNFQNNLSPEAMAANRATLGNVRLWDWQPLHSVYAQLQEIRPYYQFKDVDIDRYHVADPPRSAGPAGPEEPIRQVMLAAREMNNQKLPEQGRTWVNQHLKYTHGYGVVMNPANEVDPEGLPRFWLRDLPPRSDAGFQVERPQIYFGETTDRYVIVKTTEREFDYPAGDQNQETTYQGTGGVPISGLLSRAAYAVRLGSMNLLVSSALTDQSRVLVYRNIREAAERVAPFLRYDHDPYLVLHQGRLVWMMDAYTTSNRYPYSEPFRAAAAGQGGVLEGGAVNYVRNSVKVVINAYDGTMTFYLADPQDPIAATYERIFPSLFRPLTEMPEGLRQHVRYPEDLFTVQAQMYATYHMTNPEVFYNREDTWALTQQVHNQQGNQVPMDPYYTVLRLPGETAAEFVLMIPYTPGSRPNMISWLIARADSPNYGQLQIYKLPKQETIYGPMQVEGRIDNDTVISQNLTLWSQSGSEVIRGNLLVVPVENSVLYVEPLYLQATNNRLPELKRVIVAYRDQVVMEPTLEAALARIFGQAQPGQDQPGPAGPGQGPTGPGTPPALGGPSAEEFQQLAQEAGRLYNEAQELLRSGDWAGYGERMQRLGEVLVRMQGQKRPQTGE